MAMQKLRRDRRIGEGITMSEVTTEPPKCTHHWVIQPANGPVSLGVCKFCREILEFRNHLGTWEWHPRGNRQPAPLEADAEEDE